jgi:hypothetical protein
LRFLSLYWRHNESEQRGTVVARLRQGPRHGDCADDDGDDDHGNTTYKAHSAPEQERSRGANGQASERVAERVNCDSNENAESGKNSSGKRMKDGKLA